MKLLLTILLLLPALVCAEEDNPLPGHSHIGDAFDEGPRQSATLLGKTGKVTIPITSTWPKAQAFFDQGLGQLHGFWYFEAERSFREIAAHDPDCAMAYWGMAMANWENTKRAKEFTAKATALKEKSTPHEKLYINAHGNYFDYKAKDEKNANALKKRNQKHINDFENIIHEFPDDLEARAILVCRIWQFSRKGLPIHSHEAVNAILDQIHAKDPMHPAHHFRIHLWDKTKASRALKSAAQLGPSAPSIAHMWHMPGHIYSKLHRYQDSAWHQQASARIDHRWMLEKRVLPDQIHNYAHNNEWLVRNWINIGRTQDALAMAKTLIANPRHPKLNKITQRSRSAGYGRARLITVLTKFELWDQALALAESPFLLEEDLSLEHQRDRFQLIGTAHFEKNNKDGLTKAITPFDALISQAQEKHEEAATKAREKATKEKKSKKDIEKAVKAAGKKNSSLISSLKKAKSGLQTYLAILNKDLTKAREKFGDIKREKYALALLRLRLGDSEEALKLSEAAITTKTAGQVLPLAARIEVLHGLGKSEEARKAFEELRKISSSIDRSTPPFARLVPIAAALDLPADWTLPAIVPDDIGQRPELDTLGPIAWTPPNAPEFTLPDGKSKPVQLSSFLKRPTILILFLGHACLHCAEQLQAFAEHHQKLEAAGFNVLCVSTDTVAELQKSQLAYVKDGESMPFTLLADPKCKIFRQYNSYDDFEDQPLHGTFLIDTNGKVLWQDISADPFDDPAFLQKEALRLLPLHQKQHSS
ncbi:MAG: peroxiredoxin [Cryomorphaceae bacterium]|jgi:peroxiredoxin